MPIFQQTARFEERMNNCPSCKKAPPSLQLSRIGGTDKVIPPFECVTLCCPLCGAILMAIPEFGPVADEGSARATGSSKGADGGRNRAAPVAGERTSFVKSDAWDLVGL